MAQKKDEIELTDEQLAEIDRLVSDSRRYVPNFYDEGECEVMYVPIDDGELRVFHYQPEKQETKRPILFIPGFATTPWSWRQFHNPHHGIAEYYHLETREKKSSKIKKGRKVKFTIDQSAKDLGEAIRYLELDKRDFLLLGASYCGGIVLQGLINRYFNPPTTVVFDPTSEWAYNRFLIKTVMRFVPLLILSPLRIVIARLIMRRMKNQVQKERNLDFIRGGDPLKWKKATIQNVNFTINNELQTIKNEVFVFHGPKDRHHPDETFVNIARKIPKGRYFYMNTTDENREQLVGIIGTAFAHVTKDEGVPPSLAPFEFNLNRTRVK